MVIEKEKPKAGGQQKNTGHGEHTFLSEKAKDQQKSRKNGRNTRKQAVKPVRQIQRVHHKNQINKREKVIKETEIQLFSERKKKTAVQTSGIPADKKEKCGNQ